MNPVTFFEPLLGQSLLYPGQSEDYRGQCVQSVMLWLKATGTEPPVYSSAYLYYDRGISGYTQIPAGQPIKMGDIVVWRKDFPPAIFNGVGNGHIDVASADGSLGNFSAYDQNWAPLKLEHILHTGNNNNYIAGYLRKEEDMPTQKQVYDHFHAYDVLGKLANGDPSQDQLDYYSSNPWSVLYLQLLDYNHDRRKELQAQSGAKYTPYAGSQLFVKQ